MKKSLGGIIIQIASSGSNFLLTLSISRAATAADFGSFSLMYAVLAFGLGIMRSSLLDLLLLRGNEGAADQSAAVTRSVMVASAVGGLGFLIVSLTLDGAYEHYGFWLALGLPIVLVNDLGRFLALSAGDTTSAVRSDVIWLLVAVGAVFAPVSATSKVVLWVLGAAMGSAANRQLRPALSAIVQSHSGSRFERPQLVYGFDFLLLTARGLLFLVALGSALGPAAVAGVAMGKLLFQPVASLLQGMRFAYLGALTQEHGAEDRRRNGRFLASVAFLAVFGCGWTALVDLVPVEFGVRVFGESFAAAAPFLWALCLFEVARLIEVPVLDAFKARREQALLLGNRLLSAALLLALAGAVLAGVLTDLDQIFWLRLCVGMATIVTGLWSLGRRMRSMSHENYPDPARLRDRSTHGFMPNS